LVPRLFDVLVRFSLRCCSLSGSVTQARDELIWSGRARATSSSTCAR
jgi:hypothetical protein